MGGKKLKRICVVLCILLIIVLGILIIWNNNQSQESLMFYLPYESSYDTGWQYKLSEDNIIQEVDDIDYDMIYGQDIQYWSFEPVNSGTITIDFIYRYESAEVQEECFSLTYLVDEENNIVMISDDNFENTRVEVLKEPLELFWIKCNHYFMKVFKFIIAFILSRFF